MLELKNIQKSFDGVPVLKDISIQVNDGEIVSILGPSSCGKTTLLNLILGIMKADECIQQAGGRRTDRSTGLAGTHEQEH